MFTKAYRYAELRDNIHQLNDDEFNELFAYEEALIYDHDDEDHEDHEDHENNENDEQESHVSPALPSLKTLLEPIQSLATLTLSTLLINQPVIYYSPYAHTYASRENTGGNYCGHDPKAPRFILHTNLTESLSWFP